MSVLLHISVVLASVPLVLGYIPEAIFSGCFNIPSETMPLILDIQTYNMVPKCTDRCYEEGYQYAALRRPFRECGCGRDIPFVSEKLADSDCSVNCLGSPSLTCGSQEFHSVYELKSFRTPIDIDRMEGFLYGYLTGVSFINMTKPDESQALFEVPERIKQVDFHWKKQMIFAFSSFKRYSYKLGGNSSAKRLASVETTSCDAFAVDWLHDRLLWADCGDDKVTVKSSDLDGNDQRTLIGRNVIAPALVTRMEVDPIDGKVFWMFSKTIESCSLDGTNLQLNLTRTNFSLRGLALDLPSKRLFFVGLPSEGSAVLYSTGYSGDQLTAHWPSEQMKAVYGLSVFRGIVYWTNYEGRDVIFEAPLNNSAAARKIAEVKKSVWHIRLVHPDLQPRPSGDPCDTLQCSVGCDAGRCLCPEGQHLAPDLRTCRGNEESLVNITFVGCHGTISQSAIGQSTFHIANLTLGKCVDQCRAHSARYVAVDTSTCRCGPDIPYESNKFEDAMCDSPCPDNATASCGGDGVHSVYDVTGDDKTTAYREGVGMLVANSRGVLIFNTSRKFDYGILRNSSSHVDSVDYHWQKKLSFSIDSKGVMYRSSLNWTNGNQLNMSSVKIHSVSRCDGFAVDWVHDRIFWVHCQDETIDYEEDYRYDMSIRTINLDGEDEKTLLTQNTENTVRRMVLDPYAGKLFWIWGGGSVQTCDLEGNNLGVIYQTKAAVSGRPSSTLRELSLDLASRRIFIIEDTTRFLISIDYSGGDQKDHWRNVDDIRHAYGLGVVNDVVYWVNWVGTSDVLYQAPLSDPSKLEVVRAVVGVWHMRVVHPSLQADPCAVPECKADCEDSHPYSTACQCPKHCKMVSEALGVVPVAESVFLGVLLLAAMFSVAALMLYFSDKYWSLIKNTVSRTPMPSYRHSFPDGTMAEDNVNLVDD